VHLAELTRASRLFLVAVVRLGYLGDGFAVGDLRGDVIVLELVLRGDARAQDVQVVDVAGMLILKILKNSNQIGLILKGVYNEIITFSKSDSLSIH
jgi:hypothetical protein